MLTKEKLIEKLAGEAIAQKPDAFKLSWVERIRIRKTLYIPVRVKRSKWMHLYAIPLQKMALLSSLILELDVNEERMKAEPVRETMRIIANQTPLIMRIIAIVTIEEEAQYHDENFLEKQIELLSRALTPTLASELLMRIILRGDFINFANTIGLTLRINITAPKADPIVKDSLQ